MKILIVDGDAAAANFLARGLREDGNSVDLASDGVEGLDLASDGRFDAIVAARAASRLDGLQIIESLRQSGNEVPVLLVADGAEVEDRVRCLRAGADDYLIKPYATLELIARLEAILRRRDKGVAVPLLRIGDLELDRMSRSVRRQGRTIVLQPREFRMLEYLLRHAGQVVTRTMLLESLWDIHFDPKTNVVDVHVSRLRQKIDKGFRRPLIHTVRGAGYMIRAGE